MSSLVEGFKYVSQYTILIFNNYNYLLAKIIEKVNILKILIETNITSYMQTFVFTYISRKIESKYVM
jgi:hypothetical protein